MAKKAAVKKAKKKAENKPAAVSDKALEQVAPAPSISSRFGGDVARIIGPEIKVAADFDVLNKRSAERSKDIQAHLLERAAQRKTNPRPVSFKTADTIQSHVLPLPHFSLQHNIDAYGLPQSGIIEIIGKPSIGKTSFALTLTGHIMLTRNAAALYMPCEGEEKMMKKERMLRCLSTTKPLVAAELLKRLHIERVQALGQLQPKIQQWVETQRNGFGPKDDHVPGIPKHIPLVVIIDPFSRLMSDVEAQGNIEWDDFEKKATHEAGQGSNFNHAKFANAFSRWLPSFCDINNVLVIFVHQQTVKVNFGEKSNPNESEWKKDLRTPNYIGGKALEGLSCLSWVMALMWEVADDEKRIIGKNIGCRVHKQAHGEGGRITQWFLRSDHKGRDRTGTYLDPSLHFGSGMMELMKKEGLLGIRQNTTDKLYSSTELGLKGLTADQMDALIHAQPAILDKLGKALRISGYVDIVAEIEQAVREESEKAAAKAESEKAADKK